MIEGDPARRWLKRAWCRRRPPDSSFAGRHETHAKTARGLRTLSGRFPSMRFLGVGTRVKTLPLDVRFWRHVKKVEGDGCWEWQGCLYDGGYGLFRLDGRNQRATRVAWLILHGPIPEGIKVLHTCDNPPCVRPDHLFLGTDADNARDKMLKGRARWGAHLGEANACAKLTAELVKTLRTEHAQGVSYRALARKYGLHYTTVGNIIRGETWGHLVAPASEFFLLINP